MSGDSAIFVLGVVAEVVLAALLIYRRAYRQWPVFTLYILWGLISDLGMRALQLRFPSSFIDIYIVEMSIDSLLQYGILIEIAHSVFRPFRASLPRWLIPTIAGLLLLLCAAAWPLTTLPRLAGLPPHWIFLIRLQQTFSYLRIAFFVTLAACSHLIAIGWRDRELQIASGLGFYSIVSLGVAVLHTHQFYSQAAFHRLDEAVSISYVCALVYWVACFVRPEPPRREFSPAMQHLLMTVSGAARDQRSALKKPEDPKPDGPGLEEPGDQGPPKGKDPQ